MAIPYMKPPSTPRGPLGEFQRTAIRIAASHAAPGEKPAFAAQGGFLIVFSDPAVCPFGRIV